MTWIGNNKHINRNYSLFISLDELRRNSYQNSMPFSGFNIHGASISVLVLTLCGDDGVNSR